MEKDLGMKDLRYVDGQGDMYMNHEELKKFEGILAALFETYETIYDVNLEDDSWVSFHESDSYSEFMLDKEGNSFFEDMERNTPVVIAREDRDYVSRMMKKDVFLKGLEQEKYYSIIYRIMHRDRKIYVQLRATKRLVDGVWHAYIGIRDVDNMIAQEMAHREELSSLRQKESNHMRAILSTAAAYMEINLTEDRILEYSFDTLGVLNRLMGKTQLSEGKNSYSMFHEWMSRNLINEDNGKYQKTVSIENIRKAFERGERRVSVTFEILMEKEAIPFREFFFLYRDHETEDIMAFSVIYDLTEKQREEKKLKEMEQRLENIRLKSISSQMQPHFLYNVLGSIQEVMLEDPEYASELLGYFTMHLRSCIRALAKEGPVPFRQELENVKAYLNIEKMRFGEKLRIHYDIQTEDFTILPLTIQPLIENAIRHGIYQKGVEGGDVYLSTWETEDAWMVCIRDNGVGFDMERMEKHRVGKERVSTGLYNVRFRIENVMHGELNVHSKIGEGTIVTITIPKGGTNESDHR